MRYLGWSARFLRCFPSDFFLFSFGSRLSLEPEAEKNIRTTGDVELQKLAVVPQTVFLKSRASDSTLRSSRVISSRRSTNETFSRTSVGDISRMSRASSIDIGPGGAPFEDLRRRLATINASASSLSLGQQARDHRPTIPLQQSSSNLGGAIGPPSTSDRPGSPTDSVVSTTNSSSLRPQHRLHVGSTDGQKAAPAVGSSKTNATGLLEAPSKIRSDGSPERSGRSSPQSVTGTIRGAQKHRVPPLLPISTYGEFYISF